MNKKAIEMTVSTIAVFILVIIVLAVLIFIFKSQFVKETDIIGEKIDSLGDCDCDGVANFLDKCPCIPFTEGAENPELSGCPSGQGPAPCNKEQCEQAKTSSPLCAPK